MVVQLDFSWAGRSASDFSRIFNVAASVNDFSGPFEEIAKSVIAPSVEENFQQGGRPAWVPLADSTKISKSRRGYPSPSRILVATGAMADAASDPKNYKISKTELKAAPFGIPYWGFHQTGGGKLPQRVIMMLQVADRTKINAIFAKFMRTFMSFTPGSATIPFTGGRSGA